MSDVEPLPEVPLSGRNNMKDELAQMDFRDLFRQVAARPSMFLWGDSYLALASFISGCDAATERRRVTGQSFWTRARAECRSKTCRPRCRIPLRTTSCISWMSFLRRMMTVSRLSSLDADLARTLDGQPSGQLRKAASAAALLAVNGMRLASSRLDAAN